ncbi:MAG TPA: hypothetical protein VKW04_10860 [Planctomycetota bacterium]|nr:hypothetical protein [Planctomycetota bacterium]
MRDAGFLLMALGASSLLMKALNRHPVVMGLFGPYELPVAIACVVVGPLLFALSFRKKRDVPKAP